MSGQIRVERDGDVCTITIENEGKRNALSAAFLPDIRETLAACEDDDVRCVVLTGAGEQAFSAGYDITEVDEAGRVESSEFRPTVEALAAYPYPTIAMVNGDAVGGAFELVAACDIRVGVPDARVGITPAKLGLVYEAAGLRRVVDIVGPANAKELLFTGRLVDAERAREMGLFNHVVGREELGQHTEALARDIAGNAPLSLTGMKGIIDAILDERSLTGDAAEWAAQLNRESRESRDHVAAVEAFRAGEEPAFEGR